MCNKNQPESLKEAAHEAGADKSEDALDRITRNLDLTKKPEPKPAKKRPHRLGRRRHYTAMGTGSIISHLKTICWTSVRCC